MHTAAMTAATPDRRTFLAGICGLLVTGAIAQPGPASAAAITVLKNGKVQLQLSQVKELAKVGGTVAVTDAQGRPIAVRRTGAKTYAAFSLVCPHAGQTVAAKSGGKTWTCPGHGARFDANTGAVVGGPAPTGLSKLRTTVKAGILTVG